MASWNLSVLEGVIDGGSVLLLGGFIVGFVVLWMSGFVASSIAQAKGYSGEGYFLLGFFLPLVGILAAGLMPSRTDPARQMVEERPDGHLMVGDTVGELERLDALRRSGAIDDDEFAELKRRVVWGDDGPTESNG